jgi:hypothetical protein
MNTNPDETDLAAAEFAERVHRTQRELRSELKPRDDFVLCGSGSSGSVVATLDLSTDLEAGRADLMVCGNVDGLTDISRITGHSTTPTQADCGTTTEASSRRCGPVSDRRCQLAGGGGRRLPAADSAGRPVPSTHRNEKRI